MDLDKSFTVYAMRPTNRPGILYTFWAYAMEPYPISHLCNIRSS